MRDIIVKDNDPKDGNIWIELDGNVLILTTEEGHELMDKLYHIITNMDAE